MSSFQHNNPPPGGGTPPLVRKEKKDAAYYNPAALLEVLADAHQRMQTALNNAAYDFSDPDALKEAKIPPKTAETIYASLRAMEEQLMDQMEALRFQNELTKALVFNEDVCMRTPELNMRADALNAEMAVKQFDLLMRDITMVLEQIADQPPLIQGYSGMQELLEAYTDTQAELLPWKGRLPTEAERAQTEEGAENLTALPIMLTLLGKSQEAMAKTSQQSMGSRVRAEQLYNLGLHVQDDLDIPYEDSILERWCFAMDEVREMVDDAFEELDSKENKSSYKAQEQRRQLSRFSRELNCADNAMRDSDASGEAILQAADFCTKFAASLNATPRRYGLTREVATAILENMEDYITAVQSELPGICEKIQRGEVQIKLEARAARTTDGKQR
jgi:predicted DNA-binding protein